MAHRDRRIPWRQGHVLTTDAAKRLHLVTEEESTNRVVIIISHDCDLVRDSSVEPMVEVIIGRLIDRADGNFTYGKSSRRIHLPATHNGIPVHLELLATDKRITKKECLIDHEPGTAMTIAPRELNILQHWLAARYRRSAFPDAFNDHLKQQRLDQRLVRIIKPLGNHLVAVFFEVNADVEPEQKDADDPYVLSVYLLYSTDTDPLAAEEAAKTAAQTITDEFRERCFDQKSEEWNGIELLVCEPISDEALTYKQSLMLKRWNADDISLREDPPQPMIDE